MLGPLIISVLALVIEVLLATYITGGVYIISARNGGLAGGFGSLLAAIIVLSGAYLSTLII